MIHLFICVPNKNYLICVSLRVTVIVYGFTARQQVKVFRFIVSDFVCPEKAMFSYVTVSVFPTKEIKCMAHFLQSSLSLQKLRMINMLIC